MKIRKPPPYYPKSRIKYYQCGFEVDFNYINLNVCWERKVFNIYGNGIYYETSEGYWLVNEYDQNNNNVIFAKNSEDRWCKWEYNQWGNEIYNENSDGYWVKSEYDNNGKIIYYEDSTGYIEDKR